MKRLVIFLLGSSLLAMDEIKKDIVIDIPKSQDKYSEVKCECKLCKGTKITIATNILSIAVTAMATALINYSQCSK